MPRRTQHIQKIEHFTPQREGVHVAASVTAIDLFDRRDGVLLAKLVPDKTFEPIERVDHDRFVIMFLVTERFQCRDDVIELRRQWEAIAVDLVESVFGLDEDRFGSFAAEGGLADSFDAVEKNTRRLRLSAALDGFKNTCHRMVVSLGNRMERWS